VEGIRSKIATYNAGVHDVKRQIIPVLPGDALDVLIKGTGSVPPVDQASTTFIYGHSINLKWMIRAVSRVNTIIGYS
jgi:hypothetical protein